MSNNVSNSSSLFLSSFLSASAHLFLCLPLSLSLFFFLFLLAVMELLYWRNPRNTGVVFGSVLLLLVSLTRFSALSVLAHVALAVLTITISFRAYKSLLQAIKKTEEGHPFK